MVARTALIVCAALAVTSLWRARRQPRRSRATHAAAWTALALYLYQNLFNFTSNNKPENAYAFAGVIAVCALASAPRAWSPWRPSRWLHWILVATVLLPLFAWGLHSGWARRVHIVFRHSEFDGQLDADGWRQLRWGKPTRIGDVEVRVEDVNGVIGHLRRREGNFFVFPDFTFLYALLGRVSPQPVLWFHWRMTYPTLYDPELDQWIVRDLQRHDVRTIVLEESAWLGSDSLSQFPLLVRWIDEQFEDAARFGMFRVLERR